MYHSPLWHLAVASSSPVTTGGITGYSADLDTRRPPPSKSVAHMSSTLVARAPNSLSARLARTLAGCTQEQIDRGCMWRSDLRRCQCPEPPPDVRARNVVFTPAGGGGGFMARRRNMYGAIGPALGLSPYVYGQPGPWAPPLALQPHFKANPGCACGG